MIEEFNILNQSGVVIPVELSYPMALFKNVDNKTFQAYFDGSNKGISWMHDGTRMIFKDPQSSIEGLPTVDLNYIVAIYRGVNDKFPPPSNAIIYNADGSVHKTLQVPKLKSQFLLDRIAFHKEENPPLEAANYEGGLFFSDFSWRKYNEEIVNAIDICYDREYFESQIIDPVTGEFGECLGSWRN